MKRKLFLLAGVFAFAITHLHAAEILPLAGEWRFALDRNDVGTNENWFAKELPDKIKLPGILQAQGFGDDISTNTPWVLTLGDAWWKLQPAALREHFSQPGHVEVPFLSQPPKHYVGAAWYQRDVEIPKNWNGKHFTLFLERAHWKSTVWLDDKEIGSDISLSTPHEYDLGQVAPGKHRLTIRVDNRLQLPTAHHLVDSHSISDALGAAWNGIVGKIELRATPPVWIDEVRVFPNLQTKSIVVRGHVRNVTGQAVTNTLTIWFGSIFNVQSRIFFPATNLPIVIAPAGTNFESSLSINPPISTWEEFESVLYGLDVTLNNDADPDVIKHHVYFGFREITTRDKDILINSHPVNLRMTHFGGDFPLTGYPAMDVESWKKIFQTCKDYGLNGMRFHSWCPPEAAFEAADELGFYLAPECGLWADFGNEPTREFLEAETARILKAYGNHPSFILLSPSNEPRNYAHYLPQWAATNYAKDNRRLYCADTGWGDPSQVAAGGAQYAVLARYSGGSLRGPTGWFGRDYADALTDVHIPVLAHEVGQWCAYPDFDVMHKFTGYLQPGNYDILKYIAEQNGVLGEDRYFAQASGRFQLECYKEEIEANLRTPGLAGVQLLDLHDYLGQGTALIGVLDAFWENKGYTQAPEFKKFCSQLVPLARLTKRTFTTVDKFEAPVEVANFGASPLTNAVCRWEIRDPNRNLLAHGDFASATIPIGKNFPLGTVSVDLSKFPAPLACSLVVYVGPVSNETLGDIPLLEHANDWTFWLYPSQVEDSKASDVLVTSVWSDAEKKLADGGKVLFMPTAADLDPAKCPPMKNVPIFWNIQMTVRPPQNPRARFDAFLGLLCETNSPALAEFPTDINCDWQWTQLINNVRPVNLTAAPRNLKPIVWSIDDWNRNWKLGVIFECKVGNGKLLVSAINLDNERGGPELQQLRRSLLDYMGSDKFKPSATLTLEQIASLWARGSSNPNEPARVFDPDLNDGSIPAKPQSKP
jgi:hypothetical protein